MSAAVYHFNSMRQDVQNYFQRLSNSFRAAWQIDYERIVANSSYAS
jgi:hypothetical protein